MDVCLCVCASGGQRQNQWSRVRVPGIREPPLPANVCAEENRTQDLQKSSKRWIVSPGPLDGFMFSCQFLEQRDINLHLIVILQRNSACPMGEM